jgi:predicted adenylyl cyclase CyaB
MLEIERKAWVRDPDRIEAGLSRLGTLESETLKQDRYYLVGWEPGGRIDFGADPIFRVRLVGERAVLGWKRRTFVGQTEVNEEREIALGEPGPVLEWLEGYLGLVPFVHKRKRTRLFVLAGRFSAARAELNHVETLGHFLEVEILAGRHEQPAAVRLLDEIFEALEIPPGDVETRYYIDLLMERARASR